MSDARRVDWAPVAVADLEDILGFIAKRESPERAAKLYAAMAPRIAALAARPQRGRIVPELKRIGITTFREIIVSPYRVFYRVDGPIVGIVGVLDGRRDIAEVLAVRGLRG